MESNYHANIFLRKASIFFKNLCAIMVDPTKEQLFGAVASFLLKVVQVIVCSHFEFVQPTRNSDMNVSLPPVFELQ